MNGESGNEGKKKESEIKEDSGKTDSGEANSSSVESKQGKDDELTASPSRKRPRDSASTSSSQDGTSSFSPSGLLRLLQADQLAETTRLSLLHSLALDPLGFRLSKAPQNIFEKMVRENMQRAFWDLLREDISKVPPELRHAVNLLLEAKQILLRDILLEHHRSLRLEVEARLNEESIIRAIEQGTFDVNSIGSFLLLLLSKLCAPHRDEQVMELKTKTGDMVEMLKGLMELLEGMKEDMISFVISANREGAAAAAREYEREQLETSMRDEPAVKRSVEEWLLAGWRCLREEGKWSGEEPSESAIRPLISHSLTRFVCVNGETELSVSLELDVPILRGLADKALQLTLAAAVLFLAKKAQPSFNSDSLNQLRDSLILITNDLEESNIGSVLEAALLECSRQLHLSADSNEFLRQISSLENTDNGIRQLICNRLKEYLFCRLDKSPSSSLTPPTPAPPPLDALQSFIEALLSCLNRYVDHQVSAFSPLYLRLLSPRAHSPSSR